MIIVILSIIISFMCGSIPTGYLLIKKLYGIDIRTKGSGNIGSTNAKRIEGSKISAIVMILDMLKGLFPVFLGMCLAKITELPLSTNAYLSIIAMAVILGHDYTPFLAFKGGKGVNTTAGAFLLIAPIPTLVSCAVYISLRFFTGIVSIKSMAVGLTISIMCIILKSPFSITITSTAACILMLFKHKDNIVRLIHNEEK